MRQRGFSLIELLVAISILGLLMVAAMPSIGTWLDNTRIRNQGDSIIAGLQAARSEAVKTNQNVSFWLVGSSTTPGAPGDECTLSNTSASWIVSTASPASHCAGWLNTSKVVVNRYMGGDSARVSINALRVDGSTAGTTVTFNGFGRISNTDAIASIEVKGSGGSTYRNLRVWLSPSGSVQLCDPAVSSTTDPRICPTKPAPAGP